MSDQSYPHHDEPQMVDGQPAPQGKGKATDFRHVSSREKHLPAQETDSLSAATINRATPTYPSGRFFQGASHGCTFGPPLHSESPNFIRQPTTQSTQYHQPDLSADLQIIKEGMGLLFDWNEEMTETCNTNHISVEIQKQLDSRLARDDVVAMRASLDTMELRISALENKSIGAEDHRLDTALDKERVMHTLKQYGERIDALKQQYTTGQASLVLDTHIKATDERICTMSRDLESLNQRYASVQSTADIAERIQEVKDRLLNLENKRFDQQWETSQAAISINEYRKTADRRIGEIAQDLASIQSVTGINQRVKTVEDNLNALQKSSDEAFAASQPFRNRIKVAEEKIGHLEKTSFNDRVTASQSGVKPDDCIKNGVELEKLKKSHLEWTTWAQDVDSRLNRELSAIISEQGLSTQMATAETPPSTLTCLIGGLVHRIDELKMQIVANDFTERVMNLEHRFNQSPEPPSACDHSRMSELQDAVTTLNEKVLEPGQNADMIALSKRLDEVDARVEVPFGIVRCTTCGTNHIDIKGNAAQFERGFSCHDCRVSNVEDAAKARDLSTQTRMDELRNGITSLRQTHETGMLTLATRLEEELEKLRERKESFHIGHVHVLQELFEHLGTHQNSESVQVQAQEMARLLQNHRKQQLDVNQILGSMQFAPAVQKLLERQPSITGSVKSLKVLRRTLESKAETKTNAIALWEELERRGSELEMYQPDLELAQKLGDSTSVDSGTVRDDLHVSGSGNDEAHAITFENVSGRELASEPPLSTQTEHQFTKIKKGGKRQRQAGTVLPGEPKRRKQQDEDRSNAANAVEDVESMLKQAKRCELTGRGGTTKRSGIWVPGKWEWRPDSTESTDLQGDTVQWLRRERKYQTTKTSDGRSGGSNEEQ